MKIASISFGLVLLLFASTCDNSSQKDTIEARGTLESIGITSFQYGTHRLTGPETDYALKSETIDLSAYEGKTVTIKGHKIEGYPVDGGPVFLEVESVKE